MFIKVESAEVARIQVSNLGADRNDLANNFKPLDRQGALVSQDAAFLAENVTILLFAEGLGHIRSWIILATVEPRESDWNV